MEESLRKKLKIDQFSHILFLKEAKEKHPFLQEVYGWKKQEEPPFDLILSYFYSLQEMKEEISYVWNHQMLKEGGQFYIAYPKKQNKLGHPFIGRDDIFSYLEVDEEGYVKGMEYKFNKMVSLDENYTLIGLKREKKKGKKSRKPSQKVEDYQGFLQELEQGLKENQKVLQFFQTLTKGYQKDWARYVYSAKKEETREKRRNEMIEILGAGYKTKALYEQGRKGR